MSNRERARGLVVNFGLPLLLAALTLAGRGDAEEEDVEDLASFLGSRDRHIQPLVALVLGQEDARQDETGDQIEDQLGADLRLDLATFLSAPNLLFENGHPRLDHLLA